MERTNKGSILIWQQMSRTSVMGTPPATSSKATESESQSVLSQKPIEPSAYNLWSVHATERNVGQPLSLTVSIMASLMRSGVSWLLVILSLTSFKSFKTDDTVLADPGGSAFTYFIILVIASAKRKWKWVYNLNCRIVMVCSDGALLNPSKGRGGGIRGRIERINARLQEREQARQARKEICYGSYLTIKC